VGQRCLMRKGPRAIDDSPQAGQRKRRERERTVRIDAFLAVILAQYSRQPGTQATGWQRNRSLQNRERTGERRSPRGVVVATGSYIQPAIDGRNLQEKVECLDPVATASGSVTTHPRCRETAPSNGIPPAGAIACKLSEEPTPHERVGKDYPVHSWQIRCLP